MRLIALIGLLFGLVACSTVEAQDASPPGVVRYLGLAVPYPDDFPDSSQVIEAGQIKFPATVTASLTIDASGNTKKIEYAEDSAYLDPVKDMLTSIHFSFTPGTTLPSPLSIPLNVAYSGKTADGWKVNVYLPVSTELTTDTVLLDEFFAANGIEPPRITAMMPIDYSIDVDLDHLRYWTVTALVSIDADGQLRDISYPIAGQDEMSHSVQMALMRARYSPARLRGTPFATDFLVTFRIFDNLKYPVSPLDLSDTADVPLSSRYFMTYYYCENDISLYPIPRRPDRGYLQSSRLGAANTGFSEVTVDIDQGGNVTGARVARTTERLRQVGADVARLLRWYPAIDTHGKPTKFTGRIRLEFVGAPRIVYIPEWMPR